MSTIADPTTTLPIFVATTGPVVGYPSDWSLADLQQHLGGIPLERILLYRSPGTATEDDAIWLEEHKDRLCELVDGVLVEKAMSSFESLIAAVLIRLIGNFLDTNNLGVLLGADGQLWILPTKMRLPDVSFIRWERFPGGKLPSDRVYRIAPDLAVEILSAGNTAKEMDYKLSDYFQAGVRLVWYIDPESRTARIYTALDQMHEIDANGQLDGQDVLPGFSLRLGELFERATIASPID
jgi:Uma2 family endonuclease